MTSFQTQLPRVKLITVAVSLAVLSGCAIAPTPFNQSERLAHVKAEHATLTANQEEISAPLTLSDVMARAVKYNLDHRVKLMEDALATNQASLATFDLLPKLTLAAGYTSRDSFAASSSMDVATHAQSLAPSTSQEKTRNTVDLGLTWNILDFGVSYFQAQQQADRSLIMKERRRKTVQTLMQSVRQAYWLAAGAQQMENRADALLARIDEVLQSTRQARQERLKPSLEVLNYQRSLLEIMRQLEPVRNEMTQAKPRLAALMNLEPGTEFKLAVDDDNLELPELQIELNQAEETALLNRPELIEADYQQRISAADTKKAIARLLPGLELSLGNHYDSNKFLVDNHWIDGGARIAWNLLNLLSAPKAIETAKTQEETTRIQRLALNMAVLSQVHIAYRDFAGKKREFQLANEIKAVDNDIFRMTREAAQSGADTRLQEIRTETASLMADLRRWQAFAAANAAYAQVQSSLGADPLPEQVAGHDVASIAEAIEANQNHAPALPLEPLAEAN